MDWAFHSVSDMCPAYVSLVPVMIIIIRAGRNRRAIHYSFWVGLPPLGLGSSNGHSQPRHSSNYIKIFRPARSRHSVRAPVASPVASPVTAASRPAALLTAARRSKLRYRQMNMTWFLSLPLSLSISFSIRLHSFEIKSRCCLDFTAINHHYLIVATQRTFLPGCHFHIRKRANRFDMKLIDILTFQVAFFQLVNSRLHSFNLIW